MYVAFMQPLNVVFSPLQLKNKESVYRDVLRFRDGDRRRGLRLRQLQRTQFSRRRGEYVPFFAPSSTLRLCVPGNVLAIIYR